MSQIDDATCLPCPFCGGSNIKQFTAGGDDYCQCQDCTACGPDHHNRHHWNTRAHASPGPEVAQDQLAATPLPKGEQRAFVEGAGGSAATHEVAAAVERVRDDLDRACDGERDMLVSSDRRDIRIVCAAASRAPGPWPTALSDEDVERISIDTVLTMGNPESRMALAHAMIRAGFRAALIRESRSGIAKAMTAHDAAEAAPGDGTCSST